jgi:hypothetical protein
MSFGRCVNNDKANKQRQFQQADARGRLFSNSRSLLGGEWCYREQMPETSDFVGAFVTTRAHVARQRKPFLLAAEDLKSVSTLINGDLLPPKAAKVIKMVACEGQSSTTGSSLPT